MKTKCEKCQTIVTTSSIHTCEGLMCPKIYCDSCYYTEFSLCCTCYKTMLCPLCVLVWDICPTCLDLDNAVLFCREEVPVGL